MTKIKITEEYWHSYHNISECYYHIRKIIESYIKNQGRDEDIGQLRLFDI
jgi:hypothetical protein